MVLARIPTKARPSAGAPACTIAFSALLRASRICGTCCATCSDAAYAISPAWFAPFAEFRFPVYGRVAYDGVEIELRQAIEPWYVLGEEPGAAARRVTSTHRSSGSRSA